MKIGTFREVEDKTGCEHKSVDGPQRTVNDKHIGHCQECGREVALELDKDGERTGKSWVIEYVRPVSKKER